MLLSDKIQNTFTRAVDIPEPLLNNIPCIQTGQIMASSMKIIGRASDPNCFKNVVWATLFIRMLLVLMTTLIAVTHKRSLTSLG